MNANPDHIPGKFPHLSRPNYIGDFGTDFREKKVHPGRSRVRYLYEKYVNKTDLHLDLNRGLDVFDPKPDEDEHLDGLLRYIMTISEPKAHLKKVLHGADVVSWRGTLTRIGASPFDALNSDGWRVLCSKFNDVVFLCELSTSQKLSNNGKKTAREKRMTYWGYKFEQYTTVDHENEVPNTNVPVSTMSNYSAVFRFDMGNRIDNTKIRIFTGAEMDCLNEKGEFIELKTQFNQIGVGRYWYQKEMKWWLQSFLVGIDTIVAGLRDDNGIIKEIKAVKVNDLARHPTGWDPAVCLNFLLSFLVKVRSELREGQDLIAEFDPRTKGIAFTPTTEHDKENAFIHGFKENFHI
ncbi:unnamed protein product [Bursaphelenchus xylophilus]|uniref:Decapping nuclease n=1 Tax=Bursaphelenchus xylophilus TaxID=6326 RepID=A0A1I7S758_BURXY|nr:unnamed protein product [Bursaphelenchus xylophilus]CAG9084640.1 unnamed protein product [Bursaphelenchus xylophilus]